MNEETFPIEPRYYQGYKVCQPTHKTDEKIFGKCIICDTAEKAKKERDEEQKLEQAMDVEAGL